MTEDELRTLAHNHGTTHGLFICDGDAHSQACRLWGAFAIRVADRAVSDYQDDHAYDNWGEDA